MSFAGGIFLSENFSDQVLFTGINLNISRLGYLDSVGHKTHVVSANVQTVPIYYAEYVLVLFAKSLNMTLS